MCFLSVGSISTSAGKIFCGESSTFQFASWGLFAAGLVFLALFARVLWCASAWFVVRFDVG